MSVSMARRPGPAALQGRGRVGYVVLPVLVVAGVGAVLAGVALTGAAAPPALADPGAGVRWSLPVVRVIADVAAALTIGLLLLAAVALPTHPLPARRPSSAPPLHPATHPHPHGPSAHHPLRGAYPPAVLGASIAGAAWAAATIALLVLTYADVAGVPPTDPDFGAQVWSFATGVDLGRGLAVTALVAVLISTFAAGSVSLGAAGLLALLSLVGLIPMALGGHAAGATNHETAVTSLGLHLLGACVWAGGLIGLVLLWPRLRRGPAAGQAPGAAGVSADAVSAVLRFSTLAGWAFVIVALSGIVNGWLRIGGLSGLGSPYGTLLLAKVAALVALGGFGWWHRQASVPALASGRPRVFARLAAVEALVMAVTFGIAAALARSAPPIPAVPPANPTLAESITGYPLPPEPTPVRWLTQWQPDLLWVTVVGLGAGLYLIGVLRLHRRGDRWPVLRTVAWLAGLAVIVYATCGPPAVYGRVLFSAHMLGHMTLSMLAPMLLVLAAPITLALRTLPHRSDGSRGPREWLLAALDSAYLRLLSRPVIAAALFAFSLIIFYYSPLLELALTTHVGHEVMHVHFLAAGYLFMWVLMGVDPGPARPSPPFKMVLLLATMAFHAFFGVGLMMGTTVLAPDYFGGLGRTWGRSLLADQQYGGALAWGIGDLPTLIVAVIIAIQWARADDREARRRDRAADRDGDAELVAYNAMLARAAEQDARRDSP